MPWGQNPECGACGRAVYFNEQKFAIGKTFHANCLKCSSCGKKTDSTTTTQPAGSTILCTQCHRAATGGGERGPASKGSVPFSNRKGSVTMPLVEEMADKCPKCSKTVYFAEKVMALNKAWHKLCLTCADCSRRLDPGNLSDHGGNVYCKVCYGRNHGAKGYGYGVGSGILQSY